MKLISLRFKAFAAYIDEHYRDFTTFSNAGLFLICGKTGAGKTAILDAITYALYGKSSGGNRGDIYAMRCQLAKANEDTEVELVFELRGKRYKFTRSLCQKRVNITSKHNAFYMQNDGNFIPFFENPHLRDIEQKATELIGLNYEQFRQVIILPQGQFEKLLVAKSDEKEKILVSLFGAEKWQIATEKYFDLVKEKKNHLENTRIQLNNVLSSYGCDSIEGLDELLKDKKEEFKIVEENLACLSKRYNALNDESEKLFVINEKFEELEVLDKRKLENESLFEMIEGESLKLERCLNALKIKPLYDEEIDSLQEKLRREQDLNRKKAKHTLTEKKLEKIKTKLENLEARKDEISRFKEEIVKLESLRTIFLKINSSQETLSEKEKVYNEHKESFVFLQNTAESLNKEREELEREVLDAYTEYNNLLSEYLRGMSGSLAKELKQNMPCPVCGSTTHPKPAKICDNSVTQALLDEKNSELENIKKRRDEIKSRLEGYEKDLKAEQNLLNEKLLDIEKERAVLGNIKNGVKSDITDINQLESEIKSYKLKISVFEEEFINTESSYSSCKALLIAESTAIEFAENEYNIICDKNKDAKKAFIKALTEYGLSSYEEYKNYLLEEDELNKMQKRISDYRIENSHINLRLTELRKELKGIEKPQIDSVRAELKGLEKDILDKRSESTLLSALINDIEKNLKALKNKFKTYIEEEEKNKKDIVFAKRMRGDNGIGIQRYLLGVFLSQITYEANHLLKDVHNGRYRLLRVTEGSGLQRKIGLELEVYDSFTGERRGVATLSGGEKFLVALSLSIGLSTVVQAESSGISVETMFIDEGFGSLDPSSIADALNVLAKIKNSGSLIGIISHVDELKDSIEIQLEVKKERNGSKILIHK